MTHFALRARLRRALSLVTILCLLAMPAGALAEQGPNIPFGGDLDNYLPERDGWYGVLPVLASRDDQVVAAQLPVLVYDQRVYGDLRGLGELFPSVTVEAEGDMVTLHSQNRTVAMKAGMNSAHFVVHSAYSQSPALVDTGLLLRGAPIQLAGRLWTPLTDALGLLSMPWEAGASASGKGELVIFAPRTEPLDVLANLHDPAYLQDCYYTFPETDAATSRKLGLGMALALDMDRVMSLDLGAIVRTATGTNISPFLDDVAGLSENEMLADAARSVRLLADVKSAAEEIPGASDLVNLLPGASGEVDMVDMGANVITAALSGASLIAAYEQRDALAIDALNYFVDNSDGANLGDRLKKTVDKAVGDMESSQSYATNRLVEGSWQDFTDMVGDTLEKALSKVPALSAVMDGVSLASNVSTGYRIVAQQLKSELPVWSETFDEMESLEKCAYGLMLQDDAKALLQKTLDTIAAGSSSAGYVENGVLAAYLYLKTFATLHADAMKALGQSDAAMPGEVKRAWEQLAILAGEYNPDGGHDLSPAGIGFRSAHVEQDGVLSAVMPMTMQLEGQVLEEGTNAPVDDAQVVFTFNGQTCGRVSGTPGGQLQATWVPLMVPEGLSSNIQDPQVRARFTSPTVAGEDTVTLLARAGGSGTLPTAYLRGVADTGFVLLNGIYETTEGGSEAHLTLPALVSANVAGGVAIAEDLRATSEKVQSYFESMAGGGTLTQSTDTADYGDEKEYYYDDYGDEKEYYYDDYDYYDEYEYEYDDYAFEYGGDTGKVAGVQYAFVLNDVYATPGALSMRLVETTMFDGAAHPIHTDSYLCYDLSSGQRMGIADLLNPDNPDAEAQLADLIAQRYTKYDGGMWISPREVGTSVAAGRSGRWIFREDGWLLFFDYEEIALRIVGTLDEVFPYSALEGIFREDLLRQVEPEGRCAVLAVTPGDERVTGGAYAVYGDASTAGALIAIDGQAAQVSVTSTLLGMNDYETVVFYADLIGNAVACLPPVSSGEYTVRWYSEGSYHEISVGVRE